MTASTQSRIEELERKCAEQEEALQYLLTREIQPQWMVRTFERRILKTQAKLEALRNATT